MRVFFNLKKHWRVNWTTVNDLNKRKGEQKMKIKLSEVAPWSVCTIGGGGSGGLKVFVILVALQAYKDMHTQHRKI